MSTMTPREAADLLAEYLAKPATSGHRLATVQVACDVLIDHARASAEPEVVTGEQAAQLPDGSIVWHCTEDGTPRLDMERPYYVRQGSPSVRVLNDLGPYLLFYRAPEPSHAIEVGQTLTTAAELDACPVGTVVRNGPRATWERHGEARLGWSSTGGAVLDTPRLPARVLDVPGGAS